jgi:hypothetical protein
MSIQGNAEARYDYRMYAIVHPDAVSCGMTLEELGYTVLKRDTPVAVKDIQGEFLRSKIEKNGYVSAKLDLSSAFADCCTVRSLSHFLPTRCRQLLW